MGVDVARGVALLGVTATHVLAEFGDSGPTTVTQVAGGRSAGTSRPHRRDRHRLHVGWAAAGARPQPDRVIMVVGSLVFAVLWRLRHEQGLLEQVVAELSGRARRTVLDRPAAPAAAGPRE